MIKTFTQKIDFSFFYFSLIGFVVVLPFSQALVSIFGGIVLGAALLEDAWQNKIIRFKENRILLLIPAIFMIYLISFIFFYKAGNSFYDIKKALFFLVIPIAFMLGKPLSDIQKRWLFYAFTLAIFVATVVALFNWYFISDTANFGVHKISLISHIRFSFQLILIFWFLVILVQKNYKILTIGLITGLLLLAFYFLAFLFFQQSLTGLIAFGASLFFSVYLLIQNQRKCRPVLFSLLIGTIVIPLLYVFWVVYSFYDIEKIDKESI
jgi:hypothetical protein